MRVAGRQHGVVSATRLLAAGFTRESIARRVRSGLLHREFRGIYRVGHRAPSLEARYLAAVLSSGDGAALSGLAAAFLLGLIRGAAPMPEVTTTRDRTVPGVITRQRGTAPRHGSTAASALPPSHARSSTSLRASPSMPSHAPATRHRSAIA
ncbi:MAG: hypothetical protein QOF12_1129 [Solirubrobacteraceae bacterium]|nr:hypothetical protein [Solirubrobacteraceae bacterium]